ncbi:MAG: 4-demethylwyosine synthase TYW1 [Methanosarcinales archaeon]|nr:4-demethylwyosine synthase TYW1 [Methanosarcinales archaeon]
MEYLPEQMAAGLASQGYHLAGHAAVKPCLWLKRSLRGGDQCYKHHFYGIASHRCVQMTPTLHCNHLCHHCWRPVDQPIAPPREWMEPGELLDGILKEQKRLLSGYGGSEVVDRVRLEEAARPAHVALSLMGEPTMYPHLDELVEEVRRRGMTAFLVTNGTRPEVLERVRPTQLYLSLNASDQGLYEQMAKPASPGLWDRILESLAVLKDHPGRTVVRMTLVRGLNMDDPAGYAPLLEEARPDFVEVKAYMHLGRSRNRLSRDSMPEHQEVLEFASRLADLMGYVLEDQVPLSRVALLTGGTADRIIAES